MTHKENVGILSAISGVCVGLTTTSFHMECRFLKLYISSMLSNISENRLVLPVIVDPKTRTCAGHDSGHFGSYVFMYMLNFEVMIFAVHFG